MGEGALPNNYQSDGNRELPVSHVHLRQTHMGPGVGLGLGGEGPSVGG